MEKKKVKTLVNFKTRELMMIAAAVALQAAASWLLKDYLYTSLFLTSMLMTLVHATINKPGAVTMFFLPSTAIMLALDLLWASATLNTLALSYLAVGIIFELILHTTKPETLGTLLSAGAAFATVPWTPLILMQLSIGKLIIDMLNFTITSFFMGITGAIAALLIWQKLQTTKLMIKFRCLP